MSDPTMSDPTQNPAVPTGEIDPCLAAGMPGPQHQVLKNFEGKWNASVSFWMQPGAAPETSTGKMDCSWTLGGRFLEQRYQSNFMGMPFEGRGLFGHNNVDNRYEGVWADTMSTGMMTEAGTFNPETKTITMVGRVTNPENKKAMKKKTVISIASANEHTMSMHFCEDGATEYWKCMEIVYTRI